MIDKKPDNGINLRRLTDFNKQKAPKKTRKNLSEIIA